MLEIKSQCLIKPELIQRFDCRTAQLVTYVIYPILSIENHTKNLASLIIIKLGYHPMIFGHL